MSRHQLHALLMVVAVSGLVGCQGMNHTQRGAGIGSALGAGLGAIIGHQSGHGLEGAAIGGLLGAGGGALAGNNKDMAEERDAAYMHAAHTEMMRDRDARAMKNEDVIHMARNNVSDQLIISTIRNRGGNFITSPDQVIYLKNNGVSEPVIQAMMNYGRTR